MRGSLVIKRYVPRFPCNAVRQAKSRVLRRLREELGELIA
jgi:hypothetical protein